MNENDDLRACDRILQLGHHLRHNGAKGNFTVRAQIVVLIVSTIGVAENDHFEA